MNKLTKALLPQVISLINEYGVEVDIFRDVYQNNEIGIKELTSPSQLVATIKVVIDNSKSNSINNKNINSITRVQQHAIVYYAYDGDVSLNKDDYFIIDGLRYILDVPQNVLHYDLLYQVNAEVTIE
jgi:hypothetical protein